MAKYYKFQDMGANAGVAVYTVEDVEPPTGAISVWKNYRATLTGL